MQANFLNMEYKRAFVATPGQCMKVIDRREVGSPERDSHHREMDHILYTFSQSGFINECTRFVVVYSLASLCPPLTKDYCRYFDIY